MNNSQATYYVYENLEDYNAIKKKKMLTVFDYLIADVVRELLLKGTKLKIPLVLISRTYFKVPKDIRPNAMRYFIMKIPNKKELQQIASNY